MHVPAPEHRPHEIGQKKRILKNIIPETEQATEPR